MGGARKTSPASWQLDTRIGIGAYIAPVPPVKRLATTALCVLSDALTTQLQQQPWDLSVTSLMSGAG